MSAAPLPDPTDLGFPAKFTQWFPDQLEAIDKIVMNLRRFTALGMPTGSGKSVTGMGAALLHPKVTRAIYLTGTKGLQDQLGEFKPLGVVDVRGAKNYPCPVVQAGGTLSRYRHGRYTVGCDEGPCHAGVWCPKAPDRKTPYLRPDCPYYGNVWDARGAQIVSTNYAMWFAANEYGEGLGAFDLLILDEAHDADKELESFLTIEITNEDAKHAGTKMPSGGTLQDWKDWAQYWRGKIANKLEDLEQMPASDAEGVRDRKKLKNLLDKFTRLSDIEPLKWAKDDEGSTVKFCPIRVSGYAEKYLFRGTPHVVLMSATLTHKTLSDLGIARETYTFWEAPSRFPLDRRPIYSIETSPAVRVNARMSEDDKFFWLRRIDRIIETRQEFGWKGIIHTVSYERMRDLFKRSEYKDLMVIYDPKGQTSGRHVFRALYQAIDFFKASKQPHILVSPSLVTGYDFPHDDCRYQIIAKVPLPDMRGPLMAARKEIDKAYAGYVAMQKLVQACGRGMRGPTDWCECISPHTRILTDDLRWVYAADLVVGQRLLGFEEFASGVRRRFRWSTVIKARTSRMPRVRLVLDDATLVCTPNHPWIVIGRGGKHEWRKTEDLRRGDKLARYFTPWHDSPLENARAEGWLAGAYDGEGCLVLRHGARNPNVTGIYFTQNEGLVLEQARTLLLSAGYDYRESSRNGRMRVLALTGGSSELFKFLGHIRPVRLLDKFTHSARGEELRQISTSTVCAIEPMAPGDITSLQTDEKTFFAEGFGAHNTFIVDDTFADWFYLTNRKHAPRWFDDAVVRIDALPEPLIVAA